MNQLRAASRVASPWSRLWRYRDYLVLLLSVGAVSAIRLRLLSIPLERDEGEYAYAGQLILQRIPPYLLAYNMKMPGVYAMYALIMAVFSQTAAGIHLGLLVLNVATICAIFFFARRLLGSGGGAAGAAAASYAVLSTGPSVMGLHAHATHFVVLPVIGGLHLLLRAGESRRHREYFLSGVLLGLSFVMKQHALAFIVLGLLFALQLEVRAGQRLAAGVSRIALFVLGLCLPLALTCLVLWRAGTLDMFWLWTFRYAQEYVTQVPLAMAPIALLVRWPEAIGSSWPLWLAAGLGVAALWREGPARRQRVFLLGFLLCSLASVCPGFYFRRHYFITLLPALSLLIAGLVGAVGSSRSSRSAPWLLLASALGFGAVIGYVLWRQQDYLFRLSPTQAVQSMYATNPFAEAPEIGRYIREHSLPDDRIAVFGSEPEIYFYAQRHSATGYIYTYPLMERQPFAAQMQLQMIREIEAAAPLYLVSVNVPASWLPHKDSVQAIFGWFAEYTRRYYDQVGIINIIPGQPSQSSFGEQARNQPRSPLSVVVLKRRP